MRVASLFAILALGCSAESKGTLSVDVFYDDGTTRATSAELEIALPNGSVVHPKLDSNAHVDLADVDFRDGVAHVHAKTDDPSSSLLALASVVDITEPGRISVVLPQRAPEPRPPSPVRLALVPPDGGAWSTGLVHKFYAPRSDTVARSGPDGIALEVESGTTQPLFAIAYEWSSGSIVSPGFFLGRPLRVRLTELPPMTSDASVVFDFAGLRAVPLASATVHVVPLPDARVREVTVALRTASDFLVSDQSEVSDSTPGEEASVTTSWYVAPGPIRTGYSCHLGGKSSAREFHSTIFVDGPPVDGARIAGFIAPPRFELRDNVMTLLPDDRHDTNVRARVVVEISTADRTRARGQWTVETAHGGARSMTFPHIPFGLDPSTSHSIVQMTAFRGRSANAPWTHFAAEM